MVGEGEAAFRAEWPLTTPRARGPAGDGPRTPSASAPALGSAASARIVLKVSFHGGLRTVSVKFFIFLSI